MARLIDADKFKCILPCNKEFHHIINHARTVKAIPCKDIEKMRTEIKEMSGDIETIADVLAIIDKYKAESEDEKV